MFQGRAHETIVVVVFLLAGFLIQHRAIGQERLSSNNLSALTLGGALQTDGAKHISAHQQSASLKASELAAVSKETDRTGTVQAGIQTLVNKLVRGMQLAHDESLTRIAVLPFESTMETDDATHLGIVSAALLSSRLAAEPTIMQVERTRLDAVLTELRRSERGELSSQGAVSVGRLLGANTVVLGNIAPSGAEFLLTARVVDSETGRIVTAADASFPRQGLVAFSEDLIVVKTKTGAAMRSAVLPGWGQFYNGAPERGFGFSMAFLGLATAAIASTAIAADNAARYNQNEAGTVQYRKMANDHYRLTNRLLISMAGVWVLATLDAYWHGQDASRIDFEKLEHGSSTKGMRF